MSVRRRGAPLRPTRRVAIAGLRNGMARPSLVIIWPDDPGGKACPVKRDQHWLIVHLT
jgi:hypothetical protein